MVVRGDVAGEEYEFRLGVATADIAEDLVKGAVLLDDVDRVLDRGGLADFGRYAALASPST